MRAASLRAPLRPSFRRPVTALHSNGGFSGACREHNRVAVDSIAGESGKCRDRYKILDAEAPSGVCDRRPAEAGSIGHQLPPCAKVRGVEFDRGGKVTKAAAEARGIIVDDEVEGTAHSELVGGKFVVNQYSIVRNSEAGAELGFGLDSRRCDNLPGATGKAARKPGIAGADVEDALSLEIEGAEIILDAALIG